MTWLESQGTVMPQSKVDRLIEMSTNPDVREVFGFFNNHRRGQAARNAQLFEAMLRERFPVAVAAAPAAPPNVEQLSLDIWD